MKTSCALATALSMLAVGTTRAAVITDNFEADSSADYTIVANSADTSATFAFDYVAAGIPLAPRSAAGDTSGLKFTANETAGAAATINAFHNTVVAAPQYRLTVDAWMNFEGTSATTEFAHVGVGGDGATVNSIFTPISGTGAFHAFTGDGGSASDHRWFLDAANGGPGTVPGDDPSYLAGSANGTAQLYQDIFPSPPNTVAGSPGNNWVTVELLVDNGQFTVSYNGTAVVTSAFTGELDGLVSLGYADLFTSIAPGTSFGVFDNLSVEIVPEPASAALLGLGTVLGLRRRSA